MTYGINQIDTAHFGASLISLNVWPFLLLAMILVPVFRQIELRAADPVLRMSLFGTRQAVLANVLSAGAGLGEAGLVFMPALATAALGMTGSKASFMLMPVVLAMSVGSPMAGRFLDRLGSKVVVVTGAALLAAGMVLLSQGAASLALFIVAGSLIGLGLSALLGAPVRYIMLNEAPGSDRAAAQGAITLFTSTGQLISGAAVGAVAASRGGGAAGYTSAYLVIAAVAVLLTLLALGLKGRASEMATVQRHTQATADDAQPAGVRNAPGAFSHREGDSMPATDSSTTRDRIIEQATRLFVSRGYHAISMREIAGAVGVTKAALYYHFSDKEALFLAVLTASLDRLGAIIQAARATGGTTREQVREMLNGIFAQSPDQRAIVRVARQEMAALSQQALEQFGRLYQARFIGQVEAMLADGVARRELRELDPRQATWLFLGMIYPFLDAAHDPDAGTEEAALALALTIFFEGADLRPTRRTSE